MKTFSLYILYIFRQIIIKKLYKEIFNVHLISSKKMYTKKLMIIIINK